MKSLARTIVLIAALSFSQLLVAAAPLRDIEVEVYATFLNQFAKDNPLDKTVIIKPTTALLYDGFSRDGDAASEIKILMPDASSAVIADLVRVGSESIPIEIYQTLVRPEIHFAIADGHKLHEMFSAKSGLDGAWKSFYRTYPKAAGLLQFSRVGIDPETNQALVYIRHTCEGLCGGGFLVLLELKWGTWKVISNKFIWVS